MLIGSNSNWIGLDSSGKLLTIKDLNNELLSNNLHLEKNVTIGVRPFWTTQPKFKFVYGIYSRHGDFFSNQDQQLSESTIQSTESHVLPDYNLKMLFYNFLN